MTNISLFEKYCILICLLFLTSCNQKPKKETIPKIHISYFKGLIETIIPIKCGEIIKRPKFEEIVDTNIFDIQLIDRITKQISLLKPTSSSPDCDVRIDFVLNLKTDTIKLCIGTFDCIIKDGKLMERNDTLLFLIRNYSGYYDYFSQRNLDYFRELDYFSLTKKVKN
jgi:hypothetical protein